MSEAQEKRRTLIESWRSAPEATAEWERTATGSTSRVGQRLTEVIGGYGMRPTMPNDPATVTIVEALLDKLDEAKHLHEVERDRANDLLSDRDEAIDARASALVEGDRAIRERDEARAEASASLADRIMAAEDSELIEALDSAARWLDEGSESAHDDGEYDRGQGLADTAGRLRRAAGQIRGEEGADVEQLHAAAEVLDRISKIPAVSDKAGKGDGSAFGAVEALEAEVKQLRRLRKDDAATNDESRKNITILTRQVIDKDAEIGRLRGELESIRGIGRHMATALNREVPGEGVAGNPDSEAKDTHPQAVIDTVRRAQGEDHGEPGTAALQRQIDSLTRRVGRAEYLICKIEDWVEHQEGTR